VSDALLLLLLLLHLPLAPTATNFPACCSTAFNVVKGSALQPLQVTHLL
jgi:hypothetical protein